MTRAPLTNVPFVEPTSSTQRPSGARLEQRVARRDEVVAVEPDRVLAAAAEPGRHLQLDGASDLQGRAVEHEHAAPRGAWTTGS